MSAVTSVQSDALEKLYILHFFRSQFSAELWRTAIHIDFQQSSCTVQKSGPGTPYYGKHVLWNGSLTVYCAIKYFFLRGRAVYRCVFAVKPDALGKSHFMDVSVTLTSEIHKTQKLATLSHLPLCSCLYSET